MGFKTMIVVGHLGLEPKCRNDDHTYLPCVYASRTPALEELERDEHMFSVTFLRLMFVLSFLNINIQSWQ